MDALLLCARLVLAGVFLVSGVAKLVDLQGSKRAVAEFGIPGSLAAPIGLLLPVTELALAVALLSTTSAWWGALGGLLLLLAFSAGIAFNLARGRRPDCHCFGQLQSTPIGRGMLLRNAILLCIAGFVLVWGREYPGMSATSWAARLSGFQVVELLVVILLSTMGLLQGWLLLNLIRQNGRLLIRVEAIEESLAAGGIAPIVPDTPAAPPPALPVGTPAPTFRLAELGGEMLTLDSLRAVEKPVVLIFSDVKCGPCNTLLPEIGKWQREHSSKLTLALISGGAPEANRAKSTEHGLAYVLLQQDREVERAFQVNGTPSAVVVRTDGTIGSPLAQGPEQIRALVARAAHAPSLLGSPLRMRSQPTTNGKQNGNLSMPTASAQRVSRVGEPAPTLRLPDLEGTWVDLADFHGRRTLVVFWNPGCGFCSRMLDDLRAWEAHSREDDPKLLVVSAGTVEANKEMGLQSTVVLDQSFSVGRAFGATGTPSAVLVDPAGKIVSEVAVGGPAVLALAGIEIREADSRLAS